MVRNLEFGQVKEVKLSMVEQEKVSNKRQNSIN